MGTSARALARSPRISNAPTSIRPSQAPSVVGPFDLVTRIGGGTMASVHLARHRQLPEIVVALRRMHPHLAVDESFAPMFIDEARIMTALRHPNAVSLFEGASEGAELYTAMEYIQGDSLAAVQQTATALRRVLPTSIVLRVLADALEGLHAAHELLTEKGLPMSVVHRDVSPQHILIGVDGVARISGFGSARAEGRVAFTSPGMLKGKLAYMAPEVLQAQRYDRRADVFSAGVVLWEALTLQRLFPARTGFSESRLRAREAALPLASVRGDLPDALCAVVMRALSIDPAERFATATEFAAALRSVAPSRLATEDEIGAFMESVARTRIARERSALRATDPSVTRESFEVMPEVPSVERPSDPPEAKSALASDSGVRPVQRKSILRGPTLPGRGFRGFVEPQVSADAVAPRGWRTEDVPETAVPDGAKKHDADVVLEPAVKLELPELPEMAEAPTQKWTPLSAPPPAPVMAPTVARRWALWLVASALALGGGIAAGGVVADVFLR
jgi:serine/threonine protein kinase